MEPTTPTTSTMKHIVAMPYPGRGHINPMMNLCKSLSSQSPNLRITFVLTEEWLTLIGSNPTPPNIHFTTIPNVVPSERVRGRNMEQFFDAVSTKMEPAFEGVLDKLDPPGDLILVDAFLTWGVRVGMRRNIPVASLFAMSATAFSVFKFSHLLEKNGHLLVNLSDKGEEIVDYIPAVSPMRLMDIPSPFLGHDPTILNAILECFAWLPKAQHILFCTIYELESHVIDVLRVEVASPIYTIGPAIPYKDLENNPPSSCSKGEEVNYLKWLDEKPSKSVLFASLGSFFPLSTTQMVELATGLCESGISFLWVVRGESHKLEKICDNFGLLVPWCDQLKVLCHPSIGGFLSHCGWNSVQEGVYAGVPFLTFPLIAEQFLNSKLIVDDWKVGYRMRKSPENKVLIIKDEVSRLVKKLMDFNSEEGRAMRRRVRKLHESCHGAIVEDGSTTSSIKAFISDISSTQ